MSDLSSTEDTDGTLDAAALNIKRKMEEKEGGNSLDELSNQAFQRSADWESKAQSAVKATLDTMKTKGNDFSNYDDPLMKKFVEELPQCEHMVCGFHVDDVLKGKPVRGHSVYIKGDRFNSTHFLAVYCSG